MSRIFSSLTISHAQQTQPWTLPYSDDFTITANDKLDGMPHLYGTHVVLHASKTIGQIAAIFENMDHTGAKELTPEQREVLEGRSADLMTAALRLANLYGFDLAEKLVERSEVKNGVTLSWPGEHGVERNGLTPE